MEASIKANQIYDKFYGELYALTELRPRVAKQCALVFVEEVMSEYDKEHEIHSFHNHFLTQYKYWEQVKNEINKL